MNENYEFINRGTGSFPVNIYELHVSSSKSHHHLEHEILYVAEGSIEFGVEGKNISVQQGCAIFIYPETEHCIKRIPDNKNNCIVLKFDISSLGDRGEPCRDFFSNIRVKRFLHLPDVILEKMCHTAKMSAKGVPGYEIMVKALLFTIISHIIESNQYEVVSLRKENTKYSVSAIDSAIDYIHIHYNENISLDDVLSVTNYSKSHFLRIFKDVTQSTVNEYITKYRIEKACIDLIYSKKNITEIASEHGYNNIQYFSRRFKEYMNCTPKQYQKKGRKLIAQPR